MVKLKKYLPVKLTLNVQQVVPTLVHFLCSHLTLAIFIKLLKITF